MRREARPFIELSYDKSGRKFLGRIGATEAEKLWSVKLPQVKQSVDKLTLKFCKETNATTEMELKTALEMLRQELADGILGPENTLAELTRRVQGVFTRASEYRAQRIAETESSRAVHRAEIIAAKESGMIAGFKWLLSDDACELCHQLAADNPDGIGLDGLFASGDGEYDNIDCPPAHPHCMCTMTEIMKERTDEEQTNEEPPPQAYD